MSRLINLLVLVFVLSFLLPMQPLPVQAGGPVYLSPVPGSVYNPPGTTIAVRYGDVLDSASLQHGYFDVSGSLSGPHTGVAVLARDQMTAVFRPDHPFALGEQVTVRIGSAAGRTGGHTHAPVSFSFSVSPKPPLRANATLPGYELPGQGPGTANATPANPARTASAKYLTVPPDFPGMAVTSPANGTAPGYVLAATFGWALTGNLPSWLLMLDNNGEPVFWDRLPNVGLATDFKVLSNGVPGDAVLAYQTSRQAYHILNSAYQEIRTITPGNGYRYMDEHELQLLPNGNVVFLVLDTQIVDMSGVVPGGNPQAQVLQQIIQELDPDNNVVFQWRALDYIPITDTTEPLDTALIDYQHSNAVERDTDGNYMLSSRHLDEITKISRQTGNIIWRMGGKQNQFTFTLANGVQGPAQFYHQHDIRRLANNGHITLYDNHNGHDSQISRGLEYSLDETHKVARLERVLRHSPDVFSIAMGDMQRLPNGNFMIGWGSNLTANLTEIKPDGSTAFEMDFAGINVAYRVFRFPWQGTPTWPADLVLTPGSDTIKLTASWNGATEVASYRIYGGNSEPPGTLITEQAKTGFETNVQLTGPDAKYCFYRALPIDKQGQAMQYSELALNARLGNPSCFHQTYLGIIEN